ncbi:MAG TPA: T9SS type A sorting domain-containing protein [Edaphocola sp.]|nr:T9SS type A sorting domain-containing protein [Edaphocola sp.]
MVFFCSTFFAKAVIPTNITGTVSITTNDVCNGDCVVEEGATLIIDGSLTAVFQGNIHVKPAGKLIIKNGALVKFYNHKGIFLEPGYTYSLPNPPFTYYKLGARLNLDNVVLESYDNNDYWLGIRGIDYQGSINVDGILAEFNTYNSVIKRAEIAFKNYQETIYNPIGKPARIFAKYTNFIDSKVRAIDISHAQDVQIITPPNPNAPPLDPYEYDQSTEVQFANCEFFTSPNHDVPQEYVKLYASRAIGFKNCIFKGNPNINPFNPFKGVGILAYSSGIKVGGKNSLSQYACTFSNLDRGIVVINSNQPFERVYIGYSNFNCRTGVFLTGCSIPTINSNKFITNNLGINPTGRFFGIYLNYSRDFKVEGNTVNYQMSSYDTGFVGIVADECLQYNNEIYRNFIQKTNYGIQSIGRNRDTFGSTGLQILCNDFSLNGNAINERFDISSVEGKIGQAFVGMRYIQSNIQLYGSVIIFNSAGNKFSAYNPNPGVPRNYRIHPDNSLPLFPFKYYCYTPNFTEIPNHRNFAQNGVEVGYYFSCSPKVTGSSLYPLVLPEYKADLSYIESQIIAAENLEDPNEVLLQSTYWKAAQKHLVDSILFPYAVRGIKDTTILILEQISQGDEYKLLLAAAYRDNGNWAACDAVLETLIENADMETAYNLGQLKEVYRIENWLSDFSHKWVDLPLADHELLQDLANNMIPYATGPARALLSYHDGVNFEPRYIRIDEEGNATQKADIIANNTVQVYPNPTKEVLNIQWQGDYGRFQIVDVYGKVLMNAIMDKVNHQVNTESLSNGIYLIKLQIDGKNAVHKFVKQ